jgi:carboxypeptidase Taq
MTTSEVRAIVDSLRAPQVDLIRRIAARPQIDDAVLRLPYAESDLWDFGVEVITNFGFDWQRGRQDRSVHPFAVGVGPDDVRITTRFVPEQPFSIVFGTFHETGHALYEQGIRSALSRTVLGDAASLGVHESQSRLWENIIGRSRPFWERCFPVLQRRCPGQLSGVTLEQFYRAINQVQPSLIRVEADEATYNLHVMLRVELEIALVSGDLQVSDLPDAWRSHMQEYLGLTPADDQTGVLQDIHWSAGLFGYFATYTVGNILSAQLWERFGTVEPARDDLTRQGTFAPLLSWLRENIHQHGRKFRPKDLVRRVLGTDLDPGPYLRYLESKYSDIYRL